jgi:hypothetical protein
MPYAYAPSPPPFSILVGLVSLLLLLALHLGHAVVFPLRCPHSLHLGRNSRRWWIIDGKKLCKSKFRENVIYREFFICTQILRAAIPCLPVSRAVVSRARCSVKSRPGHDPTCSHTHLSPSLETHLLVVGAHALLVCHLHDAVCHHRLEIAHLQVLTHLVAILPEGRTQTGMSMSVLGFWRGGG